MPSKIKWLFLSALFFGGILIYSVVFIDLNGMAERRIGTHIAIYKKPVKSQRTFEQMEERVHLKSQACKTFKYDTDVLTILSKSKKSKILYSKQNNISYCPVGKTGGTFIKQLLSVIWFGENITKSLETSTRVETHTMTWRFNVNFDSKPWRHSRLITVARNPYTRLFSAYVDRVTVPALTAPVRNGSTCKFDVSFQEFLQIVVHNTKRGNVDLHWSPIYYVCRPCDVESTYIIKQETYIEDIKFLIASLHLTSYLREAVDRKLKQPSTTWTIIGIVKEIFSRTKKLFTQPECIGWYGVVKRLWKAFQIQGYIDEQNDLPLQLYNRTMDFEKEELFIKSVTDSMNQHPLSKNAKENQRHRALVNAYRQVDRQTILDIKRIFKPDFDLFGYSDEPPA